MAQRIPADLRSRIVQAYKEGNTCTNSLAARFMVSQSTVSRIVSAHKEGRSIRPQPRPGWRRKALGERRDEVVVQVVIERRDLTCSEISDVIAEQTGKRVSAPTISRALTRKGFSKKKITARAEEQGRPDVQKKRARHKAKQKTLDVKRLVFLDETGVSRLMGRETAWARRGERAVGIRPVNHRQTTTVLGAVRETGPVAMRTFCGGLKKTTRIRFITKILAPLLHRGDILVMDNLRCHHALEVRQVLRRRGAQVLFLPPYSRDINPIKSFWSALKHHFRQRYERERQSISRAIGGAWRSFRGIDLRRLVASAGYAC